MITDPEVTQQVGSAELADGFYYRLDPQLMVWQDDFTQSSSLYGTDTPQGLTYSSQMASDIAEDGIGLSHSITESATTVEEVNSSSNPQAATTSDEQDIVVCYGMVSDERSHPPCLWSNTRGNTFR